MSYALLDRTVRKARKAHRCIWCGQKIAPGESYVDERSVYEGNMQAHHWRPECEKASTAYFQSGEEEFDPWQNDRPVAPDAHVPQ